MTSRMAGRRGFSRVGAALVAILLAVDARAFDPDFCDKVLEEGVRSFVADATAKGFGRATYESLCAVFEKAAEDPTGAGAAKAFEQVGGVGAFERARFDGLKTAYCTLAKRLQTSRELYRETAAAVSPEAVRAWKRCTDAASGKYGPAMEIEEIDDASLSFTIQPVRYDLRRVRVTVAGFERCTGFVAARPGGASARFEVPVLGKGKEHDLACFRLHAKRPPCGSEEAMPASLTLDLEDGRGHRFEHRFSMARVMSRACPLPQAQ
jgi:hypothetical protein